MSDDEMMARFFASYVSPSERPVVVEPIAMTPETQAFVAAVNALAFGELVLPAGWTYTPHKGSCIALATHESGCWVGFDRTAYTNDRKVRFFRCHRGEFPEVERYVLWKNGVQS